jgi:prophage maintenance system killer protein
MYKETYNKAMKVIKHSKKGYPDEPDFGEEIDHKFESAVASVYQTFDELDLIPTNEGKASRLSDLIITTHAFVSGNHRIASLLHQWFLKNN